MSELSQQKINRKIQKPNYRISSEERMINYVTT